MAAEGSGGSAVSLEDPNPNLNPNPNPDQAHATQRDWAAVRVSYGLAGVLLRGDDLLP